MQRQTAHAHRLRCACQITAATALMMVGTTTLAASLIPNGRYTALSSTAMGITGDIQITDRRLVTQRGQSYRLRIIQQVSGATRYGETEQTFADLMHLEPSSPVELRYVESQSKPPVQSAKGNGGFCSRNRPAVLALATWRANPTAKAIRLEVAAFRLQGNENPEPKLCGTYNYSARLR